MDETDPIYKAIDSGGGQTCNVAGVIRELNAAGYVIVKSSQVDGTRAALGKAFIAMRIAKAIPSVSAEYDFDDAIDAASAALADLRHQQTPTQEK